MNRLLSRLAVACLGLLAILPGCARTTPPTASSGRVRQTATQPVAEQSSPPQIDHAQAAGSSADLAPPRHGTEKQIQVLPQVRRIFPPATPEAIVRVTEKVFPAVVRLDVAQEIYTEGKRNLQRGIGSGVIIDPQGHILTNYHVAGRAAEIYVTLANKERVPARLIGDDHWTDIAVVQLDMETISRKKIPFAWAELGDSDSLVVGQDVIAIGTPFGLTRTMTLGIVSNNERTFYPERQKIDEYETGEFSNWIQMDTPIAPGNSGGPLVDINGKVVGINTRGIRGQALNFAIPINTAKEVALAILRSASADKKGRVERADLGIDLKPLQDLESFYDIDINKGVLINSVDRGSPAALAGVKVQDILLEINGTPINVRFPEEVAPARKMIADLPIGQEVSLKLLRRGQIIALTAMTRKLEGAVGEEREMKAWGLSIRDVTRTYANEAQLDDDSGVVVTTMSPGYPAAKAGLEPNDVIRSINQQPVSNLEEFVRLYEQSINDKQERLLLEIQRGRGRRFAVLKMTY
jgi:serine protease Do